MGYTYTDANRNFNDSSPWQPLTSRHRLNFVMMWEAPGNYRIGVEGLFFSRQKLSDDTLGRQYAEYGLLAEKMWEKFNIFLNVKNFTDRKQTRWDSLYTGSQSAPSFKEGYTPLEGAVINAGIKIKL